MIFVIIIFVLYFIIYVKVYQNDIVRSLKKIYGPLEKFNGITTRWWFRCTESELFIHIAKDCLRLVYRILMSKSQ